MQTYIKILHVSWDAGKEVVLIILHMKYAVEIARTGSISKTLQGHIL